MPMHCGLHIQLVTVDVIYSWFCLNNTFIASTQWAGPLSRLYLLLLVSLYRCRGLMRTKNLMPGQVLGQCSGLQGS